MVIAVMRKSWMKEFVQGRPSIRVISEALHKCQTLVITLLLLLMTEV